MMAILMVSLLACKQLDKLTMFNLNYSYDFVIPQTPASDIPIDLVSPELETNTEEEFAFHNTNKDLVEEIKLTRLDIQLKDLTQNFAFVHSVKVYLKADGLPDILVAWETEVPDDVGALLRLQVTNQDLAPYLKKEKMALRLQTLTDEPIKEDLPVKVSSTFHVDAKILGL